MTRAAKVVIIFTALLSLATGVGFGIYEANKAGSIIETAQIIAASSAASDFAARQFKYSDTAHARQAVLLEIGILERVQRVTPDSIEVGKLELAYARLAMIEKAADNKDAKRAALDQAKAWDKRLYRRDEITDEQLENAVRIMDQALDRAHL